PSSPTTGKLSRRQSDGVVLIKYRRVRVGREGYKQKRPSAASAPPEGTSSTPPEGTSRTALSALSNGWRAVAYPRMRPPGAASPASPARRPGSEARPPPPWVSLLPPRGTRGAHGAAGPDCPLLSLPTLHPPPSTRYRCPSVPAPEA